MPATTKKINTIDSKSLRLIKKARKQMRRLRKRSIKNEDTTTLVHAERFIDAFNTILADDKKSRDAQEKK